jgi:UDP-N-acetylmuramate dehydrogenase
MRDPLTAALAAAVRGEVRGGEPLAAHTTLRVGGPATAWLRAEADSDLCAVGRICAEQGRPWMVLGRGSNLLVPDRGWPGVVITLGRAFRGIEVQGRQVVAGAAEPMPALARTCAAAGLAGLAFGVAIPGSVGGAVRMNAGAHGGTLSDVLVSATAVLPDEQRSVTFSAAELDMRYRETALPSGAVVVRVALELEPASDERVAAEMAEMRRWRRAHQPSEPSCGSVFRNPPGDSAGRLVEAAGLKGMRVGGARISPVHANFITTEPGATASDVWGLVQAARDAVEQRFGVRLETEVMLVGFDEELA